MGSTEFTSEELHDLEETSVWTRFVALPAGALGLYCLAAQWPSPGWPWQLGWTLFTGYWLFCWTSCFHETAHQTLCGSLSFSVALGRFLGTAMGVPYTVYRESHIRHHAYLNKPRDWELWPYSDPNMSLTFRRIFVWFDLLLGVIVSPYIYSRIFFHRDSPLRARGIRITVWLEYAVIALAWGGVLAWVAANQQWEAFVRIWVLPHGVAGILQTGRKLTEHLGMSSFDPLLGTRTVLGEGWLTRMGTWTNFGIFVHGPHHRHPRLSHDRLEEKMSAYIAGHPEIPFPVFKTYAAATLNMLPHMVRNPGVGMNVGATRPREERIADAQNFVADVTQDVLAQEDRALTASNF